MTSDLVGLDDLVPRSAMTSSSSSSALTSVGDLSSSLKTLEASFAGAEKKLDKIEWEVDQKLAAAADKDSKAPSVSGEAASELLKSFQSIKADYQALVKDVSIRLSFHAVWCWCLVINGCGVDSKYVPTVPP